MQLLRRSTNTAGCGLRRPRGCRDFPAVFQFGTLGKFYSRQSVWVPSDLMPTVGNENRCLPLTHSPQDAKNIAHGSAKPGCAGNHQFVARTKALDRFGATQPGRWIAPLERRIDKDRDTFRKGIDASPFKGLLLIFERWPSFRQSDVSALHSHVPKV